MASCVPLPLTAGEVEETHWPCVAKGERVKKTYETSSEHYDALCAVWPTLRVSVQSYVELIAGLASKISNAPVIEALKPVLRYINMDVPEVVCGPEPRFACCEDADQECTGPSASFVINNLLAAAEPSMVMLIRKTAIDRKHTEEQCRKVVSYLSSVVVQGVAVSIGDPKQMDVAQRAVLALL